LDAGLHALNRRSTDGRHDSRSTDNSPLYSRCISIEVGRETVSERESRKASEGKEIEPNVDTSRVSVRPITKSVAKQFVIEHHYSHRASLCRYALGIFYREEHGHKFFSGDNETLIGVIVYRHPVGSLAVNSVTTDGSLPSDSVLELTRLVILDEYGRNIESFVLGKSFRWLRHNDPKVKVLISYADPEANHNGTIYQATNWLYQGIGASKLMPSYSVRLLEDGPWIHSRTVGSRWSTRNVEKLANLIGHRFWRKEESSKHRYIYFLCGKREKKCILANLKLPLVPYPDSSFKWNPPIEQIELIDGKVDTQWL